MPISEMTGDAQLGVYFVIFHQENSEINGNKKLQLVFIIILDMVIRFVFSIYQLEIM